MVIESYEYVIYTALFLLPGFLIHKIISYLITVESENDSERLLRYLGYSLLNFNLWLWLFWILRKHFNPEQAKYWFIVSTCLFVSSIITGLMLGICKKRGIMRKICLYFNLQVKHPVPTAWDYIFGNINSAAWVIVRLKSGKVFRGLFSSNSFASSDSSNHDLYLEQVYLNDTNGNAPWKKVERCNGVWINSDEISSVEFFK